MLKLKENVSLVRGLQNGGIYDFNSRRFFRVPLAAIDFLENELATWQENDGNSEADDFVASCKAMGLVDDCVDGRGNECGGKSVEEFLTHVIKPRFCWLEINSNCNQHCLHCFLGKELNTTSIRFQTIEAIINELKAVGVTTVAITGGEPLLHPEFHQIVELLYSMGFHIVLLTNGTLMTESMADFLVQNSIMVKIPLFGNREMHDTMTGLHGSFDKACGGIRTLVSLGGNITVSSTVTSINLEGIAFVNQFCRSLNVPFEPAPIYPIGCARENWERLSSDYGKILDVCAVVNGESEETESGSVELYQPFDSRLTPYSICGTENIAVSHDGNMLPCLLLRTKEFVMGDAGRLSEIINLKAGRLLEVQRLMDYNNDASCSACEARGCRPPPSA